MRKVLLFALLLALPAYAGEDPKPELPPEFQALAQRMLAVVIRATEQRDEANVEVERLQKENTTLRAKLACS